MFSPITLSFLELFLVSMVSGSAAAMLIGCVVVAVKGLPRKSGAHLAIAGLFWLAIAGVMLVST